MTDNERKQLEQFNQFILERVRGKMQLSDLINFLRFEAIAYASMKETNSEIKENNKN